LTFADTISYAFYQIGFLSLPISQIVAIFALILPIVTGLSIKTAYDLLRFHVNNLGRTRPTLYLLLLLAFQIIYETVIATLALTHIVPPSSLNCPLYEQWMRLFRNKDETAIRRIQDRYDCCGFNTVLDHAWPFPAKEVFAGECQERFGRTQPCAGPWRQAEQINAGLFLIVAAVIFVTKV
jgi:hypothetical protein